MKPIYATSPLSYLIQYIDQTKVPFEEAFKHTVQLYSLNNKQTGLLKSSFEQWHEVPFRFSAVTPSNK